MVKGKIIKGIGGFYYVETADIIYECKAKGIFRKNNISPLAGDDVLISINENSENRIEEILPRKNSLLRPNVSNIDQAFIVTSLKEPNFSDYLLDKLLAVCLSNNIRPVICFTKKDLLNKNEYKKIKQYIKYYKKLGFKVVFNTDIFKIKRLFKNKTTVFTGQTGAGKSSLMNKLDKSLNFEVNEISKALGRGKHTTRYVTLVNLYNGKVLDTPGFSAIDLSNLSDEEIRKSFIDFDKYNCLYDNCMHINEKECEVKKAVMS